ncbi:MAG: phosphomannomutase/phosphoglucomutase [Patescibacteria group bacterium]
MPINPHIFRAYDIRGLVDSDLTPDTMYAIARGYATYMKRTYGAKRLACGRDNRTHGESLQQAFIAGLLACGCEVMNVGMVTSPMLYYATCVYDVDGGVNITASHNPKEYNGAKFVGKKAHSVCGDEIQKILKLIEEEDFDDGMAMPDALFQKNIFPDYLADITKRVSLSKPHSVVIDAGNGITGIFAPEIFRALGCTVIEQHCELDGNFPHHEANPEHEENMEDVKKIVIDQKADIGFSFDGDGDRVGVVDETGTFRNADYFLIPLARDLLTRHPGAEIIFDTKTSKVVEDDILAHGGKPVRFKTGHSFIETRMRETGALLAGETSGHLFFAENFFGFDDAMYAACKLLEVADRAGHSFSKFFDGLPKVYNTPEIKVSCGDDRKFQVVEDVKSFFIKRYPCLTIDGVWVDYGNGAWMTVRASNTSPFLTLRFEARDEKTMELMKSIMYSKLKEYPEITIANI